MSVLVFDFGLKHIGVAIAEEDTQLAFGLTTLSAVAGRPKHEELANMLDEWKPTKIVVGLPLNMDGTESNLGVAAKNFAAWLKGRFNLDVDLVDERLSTFEANQRSGDNIPDHALAAQIIAETWLQQVSSA